MALRTSGPAAAARGEGVPGSPRAWFIVGMLVILMALNYADKLAFGLAANPIIEEFGLTATQYGFANSIFYVPFFIATLVVGFYANRTTTTWLLGVIAVLWGVAQISMVFAAGLGMILFSRLLLGGSEGPTYGLVNHAAFKWLREADRSLASSLLSAGGSLGVMIGAPVLTWLIVEHGWRAAFIASGVASIAWCAVWMFVGKEGPLTGAGEGKGAQGKAAEQGGAELDGAAGPEPAAAPAAEPGFWQIVRTPTFIAVSLAAFAANWGISVKLAFMPLYVQNVLGLTEHQTSVYLMVSQLFTMLCVYVGLAFLIKALMGRGVSSRAARGVLGGVCLLVAGVSLFGFVLLPLVPLKLGVSILGALGLIAFPVGSTVIGQIAPTGKRAGVLGAYAAVYGVAGVIGPLVTGLFADAGATQAAGLDSGLLFWGGLTLVCGVVAVAFTRPELDARRLAAGR
ncbi:MFS transporter [Nocardiopsis composta]|uniref:MFS family permease n=1 Tax=Nocardiopsis composta TaxID=157465 RepID=A0A7W8QRN5_9ACTN|nr:MFS transporter [Nocardiopsis composta]MBB5435367.1 MFS family permease [Nocardiopsis composta]